MLVISFMATFQLSCIKAYPWLNGHIILPHNVKRSLPNSLKSRMCAENWSLTIASSVRIDEQRLRKLLRLSFRTLPWTLCHLRPVASDGGHCPTSATNPFLGHIDLDSRLSTNLAAFYALHQPVFLWRLLRNFTSHFWMSPSIQRRLYSDKTLRFRDIEKSSGEQKANCSNRSKSLQE